MQARTDDLTPNTRVRIVQGTHKGKKGVIGDARGTGRNAGKVEVAQVGHRNESYWINPNWIEVEEPRQPEPKPELESGTSTNECKHTPASWKSPAEFAITLKSRQTVQVKFVPSLEGPMRMHQFNFTGAVSSTGFQSHFVLGVEAEEGWAAPADYAQDCAEALVAQEEEEQKKAKGRKRSHTAAEVSSEPAAQAIDGDAFKILEVDNEPALAGAVVDPVSFSDLAATEVHEALEQVEEGASAPPPGYLWIRQIEVLPEMQQRVCVNFAVVSQYREMLDLSDPPPVTVYQVSDRFILVDGFHRLHACKGDGRELIPAIIKSGTWEDALLASCTANAYNGQATTSADKRRATETYLRALDQLPGEDPRKRQSLREIARATGASHATVKNIREELEMGVKILQFNESEHVQVVCPEDWIALTYIETDTLGTVKGTDKRKGVYILTDEGQDYWVHPDRLVHSAAPPTVKILQPADDDSDSVDSGGAPREHASGVRGEAMRLQPKSIEDELNQKSEQLGLPKDSGQILPDVRRNDSSPVDVDDRPFAALPPPPISVNTLEVCTALISNAPYLSSDQIEAVWKAIAHRIPCETLALHNWSDSDLKRIIRDAERELSKRHHSEYSKGDRVGEE